GIIGLKVVTHEHGGDSHKEGEVA
ncbi:QacE family quaternary ammonium compound efflux SMR transporter, partial [Mesorhizobium sp. M00.F.Ca.ET.186.01.1.1]